MQNKHRKNLGLTPRIVAVDSRAVIKQTITQTIVQSVNTTFPHRITQSITQSFQGSEQQLISQTIEQTVCSAQQPSVSQTVTQSFDEDAQPLVEQTIVQEIPAQEDENAGTPCTEIKQSVTQNIGSTIRQSIKQSLLFASLLAAQTNCLGLAQAEDLADFSLAQLLDTKVSSAAKYEQESRNAPAAVQVITAVEIAQHGWTSLAQALNSLPGLYSNNDRLYDYQGARGLAIAGDYNTRLLLLIDGQRNNDNVYGQALLGSEGWLDMSVIERIEYIPGPGSALYGSNAMFGTINVITKHATTMPQRQMGALMSSGGLTGVNVLGAHRHGETGLLLQYSQQQQAGRNQTYNNAQGLLVRKDGTVATDGVAHGLDFSTNRHALVRLDYEAWQLKLIAHERAITPSSAPFLTVFDDPSLRITDGGHQLSLSHQHELGSRSSVYAAMSYTDFHYRTNSPYRAPVVGYYHAYTDTQGQAIQGEANLQLQAGNHHLLTGIELSQDLLARQQLSYSVNPTALNTIAVNINPLAKRHAAFVQDEWQISSSVALNLGLRRDAASRELATWSPRTGLVWQINPDWTSKFLVGRAYRSPSAYEKLFGDGINVLSNANLRAETLDTREIVLSWHQQAAQSVQLSLFDHQLQHLIQQVDVNGLGQLQFQNTGNAHRQGAELSWQMHASDEAHWSASLAQNYLPSAAQSLSSNSPRSIAKAAYT
ncbi:MAG: TonB-dependent receptor, partial [Gallionella sp.]